MGTPIIYFLSIKRRGKLCISLSETQFYYIKVRYKVVKITRACFHEKAVLKILPSNLIKEMFSYCPFTRAFYCIRISINVILHL